MKKNNTQKVQAKAEVKVKAKKHEKKIIIITLLSFLLIGIFSSIYQTIAFAKLEEGIYEVTDILAKDFDGIPRKHPKTYAEALAYYNEWDANNKVKGRTGWSLKLFACDNENMTETANGQPTPWHEEAYAYTSDSGRDQVYTIEDYESQIRSKLVAKGYSTSKANQIISEAKKQQITLTYQEGSKRANEKDFPNGTYQKLALPCKTGDTGFWYNDQDFSLKFSFEYKKEEQKKCTPSLRIDPPTQTIKPGETAAYRAYFTDENCNERDVTDEADWKVLDENVAKPTWK